MALFASHARIEAFKLALKKYSDGDTTATIEVFSDDTFGVRKGDGLFQLRLDGTLIHHLKSHGPKDTDYSCYFYDFWLNGREIMLFYIPPKTEFAWVYGCINMLYNNVYPSNKVEIRVYKKFIHVSDSKNQIFCYSTCIIKYSEKIQNGYVYHAAMDKPHFVKTRAKCLVYPGASYAIDERLMADQHEKFECLLTQMSPDELSSKIVTRLITMLHGIRRRHPDKYFDVDIICHE